MRQGTYYLNNSGSKWVTYPKDKVLVIDASERYCKQRTIDHYESFGNFAVACLKYKGKMISAFPEECNGRTVFFVDYNDKY
jgi:hypothetical protein